MNAQSTSNGHRQAAAATTLPAAAAVGTPPGALSAERLRAVAEEVRQGFPRAMTASELVIIDVDPRHIHAFWYIPLAVAEQQRAALDADSADAPLVLRISEADGAAPAKFDIEVLGLQGRYYVDIWGEARRYSAEIGFRRGDGSLLLLAAAPAITLPPLGPAADKSWRLQSVAAPPPGAGAVPPPPPDAPRPPGAAASPAAVSAAAVAAAAAAADAARLQLALLPGTPGEPGLGVTEPSVAEPSVAEPSLPKVASAQPGEDAPGLAVARDASVAGELRPAAASASGGDAAVRGDATAVPGGQPCPPPPGTPGGDLRDRSGSAPPGALSAAPVAMAEEPPAVAAADAAMLAAAPPEAMTPDMVAPSPAAAPPATFHWMDAEPVRHPFPLPPSEPGASAPEHHLAAGAPAPFAESAAPSLDATPAGAPPPAPAAEAPPGGGPEGSAEGPAPLPLENTLSLSSFALGRETVELEINAELHIFGRTLPGRELHLFGRKVTVHPDGSFSISRPLPNGALIVSALLAGNGHREE